ncbi:Fungal specific transcription factor domain [Ceratobasidium sp. AG-Ba]|nr:Fungal specific transcription factor domain [Ceratobasidium sp. AG-Ba]QRW07190.1 Fungal specific transcription factor domain [Ceratobasidium sp. AG-Ba]
MRQALFSAGQRNSGALGYDSHVSPQTEGNTPVPPNAEPQKQSNAVENSEEEQEDTEGVMKLISRILTLDRDVSSNSLPYILASYLNGMMRTLFEPMARAPMVRDVLARRCAASDDLRDTAMLLATVSDCVNRNPRASLGSFPTLTLLEHRLCDQIALVKSGLQSQPEKYQDNAFMALCHIYEMVMTVPLSTSIEFQVKMLNRIAPIYKLVHADTPGTFIHLESRIFYPNRALRQTPAMDILLSLSTCRPMIFQYITTTYELDRGVYRDGLQWRNGLPDKFLIMLAEMNMLRHDYVPNIDPNVLETLEAQITEFEPVLIRSPDPYLHIARQVVQECWRQFMYIYLYMGLHGANSRDVRVKKALKRFIKVMDQVKPGRTPDAFLVIPMSLAGIAAYKERDRDIIRQEKAPGQICPGSANLVGYIM